MIAERRRFLAEGRMSTLTLARALLVLAALSSMSSAGFTKEIKGTPKDLTGFFGGDAEACRSYYRRQAISFYGNDYTSWCDHEHHCTEKVISHRVTRTGFVMTLYFAPLRRKTKLIATKIDNDTYKFGYHGGTSVIHRRCTRNDAIAGIGLMSERSADVAESFSAYYALAIPKLCPAFTENIGLLLEYASGVATNLTLTFDMEMHQYERAREVAELDMKEIDGFCDEVWGAFGENGRVIQNLLQRKN